MQNFDVHSDLLDWQVILFWTGLEKECPKMYLVLIVIALGV